MKSAVVSRPRLAFLPQFNIDYRSSNPHDPIGKTLTPADVFGASWNSLVYVRTRFAELGRQRLAQEVTLARIAEKTTEVETLVSELRAREKDIDLLAAVDEILAQL